MESKELVNQKVIIAPFNREAVFIYHQLIRQNIDVIAFFDSGRELQKKNYLNVPILPYFYLNDAVVIMANVVTVASRLIEDELSSVGYRHVLKQSDIVFETPFYEIANEVDIEQFAEIKGYAYGTSLKRKIADVEGKPKFNIKFISVEVTNKCTLNCRDCCALMPYQQQDTRKNMDMDITMKSIEKVVDCVDFIPELSIIGGEPFLNPDLKKLLTSLNQDKFKRKIGRFVISTNGTLVPDSETMQAMSRLKNHMYIYISTYGELSTRTYELLKICNQYGIACIASKNKSWAPMCKPFNPNEGGYSLEKACENCSKCVYVKFNQFRIAEDRLYKCAFLSYGELGRVIPADKRNSLDILNEEFSSDILQKYLDSFQPGRIYCSQYIAEVENGEREGIRIPIAEQTVSRPEYAKHE